MVIGSGPRGYVAAIKAAQLGMMVGHLLTILFRTSLQIHGHCISTITLYNVKHQA